MQQNISSLENSAQQNLPPPPPINLFNLNPPQIKDYSYILYYKKKHIDMINGIAEYSSSKEEVQAKCQTQFKKSQQTKIQSQSIGEKKQRNIQNCIKCQKCGYFIEKHEMYVHKSFHAAFIIEGVLLGDKHASASRKELFQRNKVTHIVNAASELPNHFESEGIKYLKLDLCDVIDEDIIDEATKAAHFIHNAVEQGGTVYVHCALGKSRSVSSIIMYLIIYKKMSYQESINLIRVNRPMANPNKSYIEQLKKYSLQAIK